MCILVGVISFSSFCYFDFFKIPDEFLYALHFPKKEPKDSRIVIIDISDDTTDLYGKLPWKREIFAEMIKTLSRYSPKVIGIDLLFDRSTNTKEDLALVRAVADARAVILPSKLDFVQSQYKSVGPYPDLSEAALGVGYANLSAVLKNLGVTSILTSVVKDVGNKRQFHFVFEIASKYLGVPYTSDRYGTDCRLGSLSLPNINPILTDICGSSSEFPIYYIGDKNAFITLPFHDVLRKKQHLEMLEDSITLVGVTSKTARDSFHTPISFRTNKNTPGVIIFANALYSILNKKQIHTVPGLFQILIVSIVAYLIITIMTRFDKLLSVLLIFFIVTAYVVSSQLVFKYWLIHLNTVPVLLGTIFAFILYYPLTILKKSGKRGDIL
jgi:CHASE2 domain-containing sensor protein